jgi:YihY family inner membrane protein
LTTQEHQPTGETMQEKTLEVVQIVEEKTLVTVHIVEKEVKPYKSLLIKCKDDWIHHLAQALAFSLLTNLVSIAILLLVIVHVVQVNLDRQVQQMLTGHLESIIPQPLSLPVGEVVSKAFDTLSHASPVAVFFIILPAIVFGSFLFSLMESCFDVIYHLSPRPFVRRHLVAVVMLLLFAALTPIITLASAAPTFILSLLVGNASGGSPILRLVSIAGSTIFSLILFQAIYVLVPHRHVRFQTLGRDIRNSWRGALVSTVAMQLGLQLFPLYTHSFLNSYIGQLGLVVITLLFFYLFALILLMGAEVNAFYAEGIRVPKSDLITQASQDGYA